jgi:DNA phosphorothioation-dependent restriction protein DptH
LKNNLFSVGEKYSIRLEDQEKILELYSAFKRTKSKDFRIDKYKTITVDINGQKLIIAASIYNIKADYLTFLRNAVAKSEGKFNNTSILFIHDSDLDSIIGGTIELDEPGMPLNVDKIKNNIKKNILNSGLSNAEKKILKFSLSKYSDEIVNIFDFNIFLDVLFNGKICDDQMNDLGFFKDYDIDSYSGTEIDNRLLRNFELFSFVDDVYKYGDIDNDLSKKFDSDGVNILQKREWGKNKYKEILNSNEEKIKEQDIEYYPIETDKYSEFLVLDKSNGNTKVQQRNRNIIIFNRNLNDEISINLKFNRELNDVYFKIDKYMEKDKDKSYKINKKTIKISFINLQKQNKTQFYLLSYYKYKFKIAVINLENNFFESMNSKYKIIIGTKLKCINVTEENSVMYFGERIKFYSAQEISVNRDVKNLNLSSEKAYNVSYSNITPDENNMVYINFNIDNFEVPFGIEVKETEKLKYITGEEINKLSRENSRNYIYNIENSKIIYDINEYSIKGLTREYLEYEKQIINSNIVFGIKRNGKIEKEKLNIDENINQKYFEILNLFKSKNNLPSLSCYDKETLDLFDEFISMYFEKIDELEDDKKLSVEEKNLLKIGMIINADEKDEIYLTPLHPINIAYQLVFYRKLGNNKYINGILRQLNTVGIMPYLLNENKLYEIAEQYDMPKWSRYTLSLNKQKCSSNNYVSKIITHKIIEFEKHFNYLFLSKNSPLIIKIINFGSYQRVLEGVLDYYARKIKKNDINMVPILLFLENSVKNNIFRRTSSYKTYLTIQEIFNIKIQ